MYDNDHLRLVVDSVEDFAIVTTDTHGIIQLWNSGAQQIFGWSAEEAHGQHARLIFTPEDQDRGGAEAEMRTALVNGRASDERWHLRKNGTRFYASGVLTVLRREGQHLGFVKIARDLTERRTLEEALRQAHDTLEARVRERTLELVRRNESLMSEIRAREAAEAQIKKLLGKMVTIQEVERRRIARDIHDELGQAMTALKMNLEALDASTPADATFATLLTRCQHLARELDGAIDFLTWELRPVVTDQVTLSTALADLLESWSERFNIPARFVGDGDHRLPPDVQEHLYRLTQEALHNIAKHAEATHVSVMLEQRGRELVLLIEDNGRGFSVGQTGDRSQTGGLGLTSMQERAALVGGTLTIESNVSQGTAVYVRVPVDRIPSAQPSA
jgi:PAS domain S-box-containing protein